MVGLDAHAPQIVRVDLADTRDLVGKGLSGDLHVEHVAFPQFGEPGEQGLVRHSRVPGDDAVRALAADGQARAVQMAEPVVQRVRVGPVAHGQVHADRRDLDRRHDPVAEIQQILVLLVILEPEIAIDGAVVLQPFADDLRSGGEFPVVRMGLLDHARVLPGGPVALVGQCGALRSPDARAGLFHADPREHAGTHEQADGRERGQQSGHPRHMTSTQ